MNFRLIVQLEHDIAAHKGQVMLIDGDNKIYFADPAGTAPAEAPRRSQSLQQASQQLEEDRDSGTTTTTKIRAACSETQAADRRVAIYKLVKRNPGEATRWYATMVHSSDPALFDSSDERKIKATTGRDLRFLRKLRLITSTPMNPKARANGNRYTHEVKK